MIDDLIHYFMNYNVESFNITLNKFKWNWVKRIIVNMTLNRIYEKYNCETLYCDKDRVRTNLIKRMQLDYLF